MQVQLGFLALFLGLVTLGSCQKDDTLIERTTGKDVTEAVIRKIQRSGIFPDDQNFLRRLAYVESRFGESNTTYRDNYFGGIWQVDEAYFNRTKETTFLYTFHVGIHERFNINWTTVGWTDLLKPLYSGLAARLYFTVLNRPIPGTISGQADFWKEHYRPNGAVQDFIDAINELERVPECKGRMDLCIVLDGSGSIGEENFNLTKSFLVNMTESLPLEVNRIGLVVYGIIEDVIFPIENNLNQSQMSLEILNMPYPDALGTNTPSGLLRAVQLFSNLTSVRPGIPKVVATFTDGRTNIDVHNLPIAAERLRNASLTSIAVGISEAITDSLGQEELLQIALNDSSNVLLVDQYSSLTEFMYRLNLATCVVPMDPEVGTNQTDTLTEGERRYFRFEIPALGLTIVLRESEGRITGWFSYTDPTPNSAVHDGFFDGSGFIFIPPRNSRQSDSDASNNTVYITVEGATPTTNYIISAEEGNLQQTEPPTSPGTSTPIPTSSEIPTSTDNNSSAILNLASVEIILSLLITSLLH